MPLGKVMTDPYTKEVPNQLEEVGIVKIRRMDQNLLRQAGVRLMHCSRTQIFGSGEAI
jgi:hypothetical protein